MVKRIYRKSLITGVSGCVEVTCIVSRFLKNGQVRSIEETGVVCSNNLSRDRESLIYRATQSAKFKGASRLLNKNLRTDKGRNDTYDAVLINENIQTQVIDHRFYYTLDPDERITTVTENKKRYNVILKGDEVIDRQRMRYFKDIYTYMDDPEREGFR